MFKRPVSQFIKKIFSKTGRAEIYDDVRLNFKKIQGLYHTPKQHFSQVDNYLRRLRKPLYYYIIGANVGVFLAWKLQLLPYNFLFNNFTLSTTNLSHLRFHTLLTYSISHVEMFHFIFNMITFYFFGRVVESYFGSKALLHLWLLGSLTSAFFINMFRSKDFFKSRYIEVSISFMLSIMQTPPENSEYLKTDSLLVSQELAHIAHCLVGTYEVPILLNVMI